MKSLILLSACGLALTGMTACAPRVSPTARVALDCPSERGELKLANIAADKKTCNYTTRDGDEVSLRLLPVSANYEATLQGVEQELQGELQTDQQIAQDKVAAATSDAKSAEMAGKAGAAAAASAAKQAADDALGQVLKDRKDHDEDKITVGSGGDKGDHADINLPGIHITADDDNARINVGGAVHVDAGENGATVRVARDVRLRGEALSAERRGFRATYVLAKDNLKDGWNAVGYEAAGPKAGPVTVAVFKSRNGRHHGMTSDIRRLVRDNAGV